jgi:ribonuclease P protein component
MLKKENRLKKQREFDEIFKKGKGLREESLFLKIIEKEPTKIGIVVSKKISKKAVERNKIKRQIREIARKQNFKKGFQMIIITYPSIKEKSFEDIENQLINLFKKAKCL